MSFRLVPKSVTVNGIMAITLRYFTEFGKLHCFGRLERMEADVARPSRPVEWPVLANEKERALCQLCAAGHGLNADRSECWPPKMAVCGCNANLSDTANYGLAV